MEIGVRLFEDRNYDAALTEFERAYAAKKVASPLINIALCHKGRFEYTKAIAMLEKALRDHRDSIEGPEKIERAISEMRELLATITVRVTPEGTPATIFLDGEELPAGSQDHPTQVSPGGHTLIVRADGFAEATTPFRVGSGDQETIDIALVLNSGTILVDAPDGNIVVMVDGVRGEKGTYRGRLSAGSHLVVIEQGNERFTLNVPIVAGKETKLSIGDDGFLRMGDAPPRPPDRIEKPPIRGLYLLASAAAGVVVAGDLLPSVGFDLIAGYRVTTLTGVELRARQTYTPQGQDVAGDDLLSFTQAGAGVRLMSSTLPVRYVHAFGVGLAFETTFDDQVAIGAFILIEPGIDIEYEGFIFGFSTPTSLSITGSHNPIEAAGRLHFGYGFW